MTSREFSGPWLAFAVCVLPLAANAQEAAVPRGGRRAQGEAGELAIQSRSMLQILLPLASTVEIPAKDLEEEEKKDLEEEEKRAVPSHLTDGDREATMPFFVRYSTERPERAYAAVRYRDGWFWIDDADLRSKRAFGFVMFLFTLSDAGSSEQLPVLTIPTG